jgi:hypothetical protein
MFQLDNFPDIISHLQKNSNIYRDRNNGWIEIFCPYCNDSTRKHSPDHGHFYISKTFQFCNCFRCDTHVSLIKVLYDTGFNNEHIIRQLKSYNYNYTYYNCNETVNKKQIIDFNKIYLDFKNTNFNEFCLFKNYISARLSNVNPIEFKIFPSINQYGQLLCNFLNSNNKLITSRIISPLNNKLRYINANEKEYYFFQDINKIDEYKSIVICEGCFDLINLYNYSRFIDSFFIAINGKFYQKAIETIISKYLLINKVHVNIIFDIDIYNKNLIKKKINNSMNIINPRITFSFFEPKLSKDVSELMYLQEI